MAERLLRISPDLLVGIMQAFKHSEDFRLRVVKNSLPDDAELKSVTVEDCDIALSIESASYDAEGWIEPPIIQCETLS